MPNLIKERLHFEKFLSVLNTMAPCKYEIDESPDFRFCLAGRTIGVEHTQIFLDGSKDTKLVALESIGNDIARRVQNKGTKLRVNFQATLLFNLRESIKEKQREQLACDIFNEIKTALGNSQPTGFESFEVRPKDDRITSIRFVATMQKLNSRVMVARAGWVKQTIDEEVIDAITKKNTKSTQYATKCDEIWLLIVADGHDPSSLFDNQPPVLNIECECVFDKVYYLDHFKKRLTEVITSI